MKSVIFLGSAFGLLLTWLFVFKDIEEAAFHILVALNFLVLISLGIYFDATE